MNVWSHTETSNVGRSLKKPLLISTGAIAAGCTAVVKPSELAPATAQLLAELFPKYMDHDLYRVINGDIEGATKLLSLDWGHSP